MLLNNLRIGLDFGKCMAYKGMESYLAEGHQYVSMVGLWSSRQQLVRGVPQESVLGPILFLIYTLPLGDIVRKHQMSNHLYADYTKLYLSFDSRKPSLGTEAIMRLEASITDIRHRMLANRLKLKYDKTEFIKFLPQSHHTITPDTLQIGTAQIDTSIKTKNLAVILDLSLNLSSHKMKTCRSATYQLYCLRRITH